MHRGEPARRQRQRRRRRPKSAKFIAQETGKWAKVLKFACIKADRSMKFHRQCSPRAVMKLPRRQFLHLSVAALTAIFVTAPALSHHACAQTTRTIKIVVPFPPGGGADIMTRLLAEHIGPAMRAAVVVENRVGAGSVIGTEAVSRAAPDGNTLLINTPNLVIAAHLRKLNYDPLTSFEPICELVSSPAVIVVNVASPYRTLADLLNAARIQPGKLTIASVGPATTLHFSSEKLMRATGTSMTYIPFSGTGPTVNALLGEHVTAVFAEYPAVAEQIEAGKLRPLATGSPNRIEPLPELPTVAESGYPGFEVDIWWGVFAPALTPRERVSELATIFAAAVRAPEIKAKLIALGYYPVGMCGANFAGYLRRQYDEYGRIIRETNIKSE
jgi:tripartite-type tricarboxylate transporter receptor subunit TctC